LEGHDLETPLDDTRKLHERASQLIVAPTAKELQALDSTLTLALEGRAVPELAAGDDTTVSRSEAGAVATAADANSIYVFNGEDYAPQARARALQDASALDLLLAHARKSLPTAKAPRKVQLCMQARGIYRSRADSA